MLQHRVSKFYLRGFAPRRRKDCLQEYGKGIGFAREVTPDAASAETNAFVIDVPSDPYAVENFLQRVESQASRVISRVRGRMLLDADDRFVLSQFAALFLIRSSRRASEAEQLRNSITVEKMEEYLQLPSTKIQFLLANPNLHLTEFEAIACDYVGQVRSGLLPLPGIPKNHHLSLISGAIQEGARLLAAMSWRFEIAGGGDFFVVADEPIIARRVGRIFDPHYVGFGRKDLNVEVSFPINRSICLVAHWGGKPSTDYAQVGPERVRDLNLRSVVAAHTVFFSPQCSPQCIEYVREVGHRGVTMDIPMDFTAIRELIDQQSRR